MKRIVVALTALVCTLVPVVANGSVATARGTVTYVVDEAKLPFDAVPGVATERTWGVLDGAGYRIEVPADWNGSLVMWAHGYRGTGTELLVDSHPLRAWLVANGFAWAASSYSTNGYTPAQGVRDTFALTKLFQDRYGKPENTYVSGAGMGGMITAVMAEQWPGQIDGALSLCGELATTTQVDYFLDFNLAAQTLSGVGAQFPFGPSYLSSTVPATKAALGPAFPYVLNAQGQAFKSLVQLRSGGVRPVFDFGWIYWNGLVGDFMFGLGVGDGTIPPQPGVAMQNIGTVYQFDTDPALSPAETGFNATVQRVAADPQARRKNGLANIPPTTGNLKIPMVTLHTLGDLYSPFVLEQEYARRVAAKGDPSLLVQRATRDAGHCSFTALELVTAMRDLVTWVETGARPAGDPVTDPVAVAAPDFGCAFTDRTAQRPWTQFPQLAAFAPPPCPPQ